MTPFLLVLIVVALFAILLSSESAGDDTQFKLRPSGLLSWLVSGNWPAKVGAGLVIIGVGALLRYAFANIDVPPEIKLGSGALAAAALGLGAFVLRSKPRRRAIHLALAGAAFGVAYLTAYSAYGFFNYINDVNALALLALVAVAAGVFAVTSNTMSVAILAMVGAYIAPKFAIGVPGIVPVYGYYLAASVLSLIMVTLRGWRPLIHLSFLFTLAGALFFGWNEKFYAPEYFNTMQPLLLALSFVHLLMPLLERKSVCTPQLSRFDSFYFIALPLVAAGLTLQIAPDVHAEGAAGLSALAALWALVAVALYGLKRSEAPRHAFVAALLAIAAAFCFSRNLPWLLIGLGLSVLVVAVAPRLGWSRTIQQLACGAAILFWVLHVISSIVLPVSPQPFLNEVFAHRVIASALLLLCAWVGARQSISFAKVLGFTGAFWAVLSILGEALRLHIDFMPQLVYGLILAAIALSIVLSDQMASRPVLGGLLIFALIGGGWWAGQDSSAVVILSYLALTPIALLGMAWSGRDTARADGSDFAPSMAIGLLPFALLPWAMATAKIYGITTDFFEASIVMASIGIAGLSARRLLRGSPRWNERIQPLHVYFTAFVLLFVTLFLIERGVWPVAFEIMALSYLVAYVSRRHRAQAGVGFGIGAMMVLSLALVVQAMLLRAFGPNQAIMTAADINQMQLPAVVSLMWAVFGASLAWWGTYTKSRSLWSAGAVLLVIAAAKLVLFDFGTLGQLGNILAFIAAGVVFLGVAWFAPIPPKGDPKAIPEPDPWAQTKLDMGLPKKAPEPEEKIDAFPAESRVEPSAEAFATQTELSASRQKRTSRPSSYRQEPKGINGLWFLFLGLAIAISLLATAWHKQAQRKKAWAEYQQQIAEERREVEKAPASVAVPGGVGVPGVLRSESLPAAVAAEEAIRLAPK